MGWCTADVRGWQGLGALLSSDFFYYRSLRLKSDAKLAPAAPSSPSLLVHLGAVARFYRARRVTTSLRAFFVGSILWGRPLRRVNSPHVMLGWPQSYRLAFWCTADVRGWQGLGALLSSDFSFHRS
ncbi:hypothetical protein [Paenibacillus amylolyticus]|uniref:hypothetical protein n=1 Tax=Paenibacillus amylolyticus TaxID=1451 RepID=UPI001180C8D5|nr:hypothetical protein [Paenibacillus amylolyticus]